MHYPDFYLSPLGYDFDGLATFPTSFDDQARAESPFIAAGTPYIPLYDELGTAEPSAYALFDDAYNCTPSDELPHAEHVDVVLEVISVTDRRAGPSCPVRYAKETEIPATITGPVVTAEELEIISLTERRRGPSPVSHPVKGDEIPTTITGAQAQSQDTVVPSQDAEGKRPIFPVFSYDFSDVSASFSASFISRPLSPLLLKQSHKSSDAFSHSPPSSPLCSFSNLYLDSSEYLLATPPSSPRRPLHRLHTIVRV